MVLNQKKNPAQIAPSRALFTDLEVITVRVRNCFYKRFLKPWPFTFNELTYTETYLIFLSCETNKAGNKYVRGCYNHIHIVVFLVRTATSLGFGCYAG